MQLNLLIIKVAILRLSSKEIKSRRFFSCQNFTPEQNSSDDRRLLEAALRLPVHRNPEDPAGLTEVRVPQGSAGQAHDPQ